MSEVTLHRSRKGNDSLCFYLGSWKSHPKLEDTLLRVLSFCQLSEIVQGLTTPPRVVPRQEWTGMQRSHGWTLLRGWGLSTTSWDRTTRGSQIVIQPRGFGLAIQVSGLLLLDPTDWLCSLSQPRCTGNVEATLDFTDHSDTFRALALIMTCFVLKKMQINLAAANHRDEGKSTAETEHEFLVNKLWLM